MWMWKQESNSRNRYTFALAFAVVFIAGASFYSILMSYKSEVKSHRGLLLSRGQTVLDALKGGILAHGRMGRYRGERLSAIFEELVRNPGILALELRDPGGTVLASAGQFEEIPDILPERPQWDSNRLLIARRVDLLSECGHAGGGRGRAGWEGAEDWLPFNKGTYALVAVLDAYEMHRAIRGHRFQLAVSIGIVSLTLGLGILAVLLLLKRSEMTVVLARERERLRRQEQVARLGAGLAHDTKNPLGIVRGLAQSISDASHHDCAVKEQAQHIVDEVDRVIGGINAFLVLARPEAANPARVDLDRFFESLLPLVQMDASAAGVEVAYVPCRQSIMADENLLRRAVLNLLLNAFRASKPGQKIRVDTKRTGAFLSLLVEDTGCGIVAEDLARVTEPYFTRFKGGSGLGLSIVDQIAAAHGWRLRIVSSPGKGTQVTLEDISVVESS